VLTKLDFASCYAYSPHGESLTSAESRLFRDRLKNGNPEELRRCAANTLALFNAGHFGEFFGPRVLLIPVPRSAPLLKNALWVPQRVCLALLAAGLPGQNAPVLQRVHAIRKSAFQSASNRPTFKEHFDSFEVDRLRPAAERILLVDDVVTTGCTLLAAAERVAQAYPGIPVRAFAVARAMTANDLEAITDPCEGAIRHSKFGQGRAYRRP
jgi:hypothetical protein